MTRSKSVWISFSNLSPETMYQHYLLSIKKGGKTFLLLNKYIFNFLFSKPLIDNLKFFEHAKSGVNIL